MLEFDVLSWKRALKMILELSEKIVSDNFNPDIIIAILRGGMIPARALSDVLNIDALGTLGLSFYKTIAETKDKPKVTQEVNVDISGKRILIVDDVADTGETLIEAVNYLRRKGAKEIKVATLHIKPWSKFVPDFVIEKTDKWIVYPWEYFEFLKDMEIKKEKLSRDEQINAEKALRMVKNLINDLKN